MMKLTLGFFLALIAFYSIFTFSLTDPNLIITSWAPYVGFQNWMWQTFFLNSQLLTISFGILILGLIGSYLSLLSLLNKSAISHRLLIVTWAIAAGILLFSYNALSHDVFNYMFNAKMVMQYDANPHTQVALSFPQDEWLRFMHNTHTPAPYAEGWTALSLFPYLFGGGKFITTWLNFRLLSLLSLVGTLYLFWKSTNAKKSSTSLFLLSTFAFNPLVLLEVISNSHNDLWMMLPATISILLASSQLPTSKNDQWSKFILSLILLCLSVAVKWATLLLVPLWLGLWLFQVSPKLLKKHDVLKKAYDYWPLIASWLMFVPLLTGRSQLFHPWYLLWSLVWLPFFNWKSELSQVWGILLIAISFSSLFRYVPWLWAGNFDGRVLLHQQLVTWVGGVLVAIILFKLKDKFISKLS